MGKIRHTNKGSCSQLAADQSVADSTRKTHRVGCKQQPALNDTFPRASLLSLS